LFVNFSTRQTRIAVFLAVWLLSVAYLAANLNHGWLSYDDGALGQSAERVLHGEIPHLDFADPYTGGLAFLDALVFKIFGVQLIWLRLPLFVFFVLWVPAVYAIARQFLSPVASAGVTLVSVAWSVPNYTAAMPSWYNLYFATFGVLAVAKYIGKPTLRWLVLAGLAGGCSFLFKSVGLYFIVAVLLFFVYREQSLSRAPGGPTRRSLAYLVFLTLTLSLLVVALLKLVFNVAEAADFLHFVFPGAAIAALLIARERIPARLPSRARFRLLLQMAVPFLLSAALPVTLFLLFYWRHHAVAAWFHGVFVAPQLRLSYARLTLASLLFEYVPLIVALLFIETASLRGRPRRFLSVFLIAVATLVLLTVRTLDLSYILALESAVGIIPILVVLAVFVLFRESRPILDNQLLFLLLTTVALCSLIQFPFSQTIYFCYISALVVLLSATLIPRLADPPRAIAVAAAAFFILFAVFTLRPRYIGPRLQFDYDSALIDQPRAGALYVSRADAEQYRELIPFVKNLANGRPIFAGPDAPEVYFLADLPNPTSIVFDSLEDSVSYERQIRFILLDSDAVRVFVLKKRGHRTENALLALQHLAVPRFSHSQSIGQFTVYWRP
jgi:Dolichyl-phosphate-mannose-protein mannosyltransferase